MSVNITIYQNSLEKKAVPLNVLLGDELTYGTYSGEVLIQGNIGDGEIIVYNPKNIGRGICVEWTPNEKEKIEVHLPQPSSAREYSDLYKLAERIVTHWSGDIVYNGEDYTLEDLKKEIDCMPKYNQTIVRELAQKITSGEHSNITIHSTLYPLEMGIEEASDFIENPDNFGIWLHEKQKTNAIFLTPSFYGDRNDGHIFGLYTILSDISYILPEKYPYVPFGFTDPHTGKALECSDFRVVMGDPEEEEPIAAVSYIEFYNKLPKENLSRFDGRRVLLSLLSAEEMYDLYRNK